MILDIKGELALFMQAVQIHLYKLITILALLFAPIYGIIATVGISIIVDTIIGIWKAKKLGDPISSRKLSQIVSKLFLYEGTLLLFFLIDQFILNDILYRMFTIELLLTKGIGLVLVSIEVFSMDENYRAVKKYGLWHAFKRIIGRAKEIKNEIDDFDLKQF